jgi:tellurite resistance protein
MLKRQPTRTLRSWAISMLIEEGVIRACEEHGWMKDRADPHARERALDLARSDPPAGCSSEQAVAELIEVLESIGDTCPECLPEEGELSV